MHLCFHYTVRPSGTPTGPHETNTAIYLYLPIRHTFFLSRAPGEGDNAAQLVGLTGIQPI